MDVDAICETLAQRIEETGFRAYSYQPDEIAPPCAIVRLTDSGAIPSTFDGSYEPNFVVALVAGANADRDSQKLLKQWLSTGTPTSMLDAIERGGDATVTGWQNYGAVPVGTVRYFAVELLVAVWD